MNNQIDKYLFVYTPDEAPGVYAVSLVEEPANETMFITLNKDVKQEIKLSTQEEKRLITGVVLIPGQEIYRFNQETQKEYYITFDAEGIRMLSQDFFRNGYQHNSTINHNNNQEIQGLTFVECWIVEDPANDKANALGFSNLTKGTWMMSAYVEDDSIWEMAKTGQVKGFSIDSVIAFEKIEMKINNKKENKKEKMSLLKKLITLFADETSDVKLATADVADLGTLTADAFEVGNVVYDANMAPLANATFELDGFTIVTDEMGVIVTKEPVVATEETPIDETQTLETEVEASTEDTHVSTESEELESFEVDGVMYYTEYLELGNVIYDETKMPVADLTIEHEGVVYVTDANGEIVSTNKNPDSPYWVEETPMVSEAELALENVTKQLSAVLKENEALKLQVEELSKKPATTKLKSNEIVVTAKTKETALQAIARINASKK